MLTSLCPERVLWPPQEAAPSPQSSPPTHAAADGEATPSQPPHPPPVRLSQAISKEGSNLGRPAHISTPHRTGAGDPGRERKGRGEEAERPEKLLIREAVTPDQLRINTRRARAGVAHPLCKGQGAGGNPQASSRFACMFVSLHKYLYGDNKICDLCGNASQPCCRSSEMPGGTSETTYIQGLGPKANVWKKVERLFWTKGDYGKHENQMQYVILD